MNKSIQLDSLQLGVCYYPEQWSDSLWEDDFKRMKDMNLSHIRIGEFAWSIFEPQEGVYDFDLFDRVLDLAHQYGLKVIMGTPTATPPAWLTQKYPEVLNATIEGVTYQHGMRRHYNYSSPKYQELCANITRQMANHFKDHPAIIGWQIDNELNCEVSEFYAEADHIAFRQWVQERYHTLEALNQAWGTVFWSQTYTDWNQVYLPRLTTAHSPNPHLVLDEKRFISDNTIAFARIQADILREIAPHHWITTNGLFGHLDSHALTEEMLDFFSYDSYPQFSTIFGSDESKPLLDRKWSQNLSVVRNISNNFCIMEQQAGPGGWVNRMNMPAPRPGQLRLWTYQSVLHGADLVMYFRWRTATFGTEIYWHGLNDYHNQPNRRIQEASQVGQEFVAIGDKIAGTTYQADIAIVKDYDNDWDGEYDIWHGPLTGKSINAWFKQLQYQHIPTDIIYLRKQTLAELQQYKVLIYPHAAIMSEQTATLLTQYVEAGGTLIFGARTGYKELSGHCRMAPMPGPVASLCGISVADFTSITGNAQVPGLRWQHNHHHMAQVAELFNDILQVNEDDVEVLATYTLSYYEDAPALTQRPYGKGKVLYYGAAFHEEVVDELLSILEISSPVADWLEVPEQVEIGIRQNEQHQYIFLLNYSDQEASIQIKQQRTDVLTDTVIEGTTTIPAYGVMILQ
ncbi:beta-galactosidase [Paenibacillus sp. KACC 21273]|uniref:beta-galactosidase n=1 Tax=Paenibacillus sp. KACC 21273 TaxID=3025665 RepID=UPI0023655B32|nr:beta-galactosidase [Paenibacillus sp. KACC 21273]WDF53039.1 beta-galactosidase [Paenibacillus sp. KACC 21273]